MKIYNSFEELDSELQIRKLEAQIDKEKLMQNYVSFKKAVAPSNMFLNVGFTVVQKYLFGRVLNKVLPFLK